MFEYFTIAWRNIWRNKRRTFITIASVFFAVFFAIIMRAFQEGSYANMVDNLVEVYTGHIQVHAKGYNADKVIDNSMLYDQSLHDKFAKINNLKSTVPRIEGFALASAGIQTKGAALIGIQPTDEDRVTNLSKRLVVGSWLNDNDEAVLIGEKLAAFLKIISYREQKSDTVINGKQTTITQQIPYIVNDTLVLIGQGYHGASAAGKYVVKGILRFPSPQLSNTMIYIPLSAAQSFFDAQGRITSLSVNLYDKKKLEATAQDIRDLFATDEHETFTWREILTELVQQIEADAVSGKIIIWILYLVVGFGVYGTALMMMSERKREFGVMVAIGMQRNRLAAIVAAEMLYMGIIGLALGAIGAMPIVYYYYIHPIPLTGDMAKTVEEFGMEAIMPMAWEARIFIEQSMMVAIIVVAALSMPLLSVLRINVIHALRH